MSAPGTTVPLRAGAREPGEELARRTGRRISLAEWLANGLGAVDVFLLLWVVLPSPDHGAEDGRLLTVNLVAFVVVLATGSVGGELLGRRFFTAATAWLREGRAPTDEERAGVLRQPLVCSAMDALGWVAAAVLFTLINLSASTAFGLHVGLTILMGGLTCTALSFLLVERVMRPVTAEALRSGAPARPARPTVVGRLLLAWACATGVPLAGLVLVGAEVLRDPGGAAPDRIAWSVIALAGVGLGAGLLAAWLAARSIADPVTSVRRALGAIERGDLRARVTVDDGSEVGLLQSGFNAMAARLADRERLRELFGRHVGEDVARNALNGDGPALGGEVREVAVLFVDLIGSTSMVARWAPTEVVSRLNAFFAVVVDVTARHGGWVNKFEGDAALVVFGAPGDHPDAAGAALAAARELRHEVHVVPGVDAGIGVSAGEAVAGNIGGEKRFEYTVIGGPVNEAARLCELAKRRDKRLLASAAVLDRAAPSEAACWERGEAVVLRGRRTETHIAAPIDVVAASA